MVLEITAENFNELVLESSQPVLVDFWAPWCGPCRTLGPIIDTIASENADKKVTIGKLNVDSFGEIASKFGVRGIPCVILFKDGVEVEGGRLVGMNDKKVYQEKIDSIL